jgi:hypothetical protein
MADNSMALVLITSAIKTPTLLLAPLKMKSLLLAQATTP